MTGSLLFFARADRLARAALDEREVDGLLAVAQEAEVLTRAEGRPQHHRDAVARELVGVALAECRVGALLGTGGEHHPLRRSRVEQEVRAGQERRAEQDERAPRHGKIAHRDQRLADDARH